MHVGVFTVTARGRDVRVEGETTDGVESTGSGRLFDVTAGSCHLTVRDTRWANGERDLVAIERHDSPQRFDTLVERLRLPVTPRGGALYVELRQVRLKPNGRGNLFAPAQDDLDDAAGLPVADELRRHGATRVGTREDLLGDDGRTRLRLGATFPADAEHVPLVAYICTRVAPVSRNVTA